MVILLGVEDSEVGIAIPIIENVFQYAAPGAAAGDPTTERYSSDLKSRRELPPAGHEDWDVVFLFYRRPWLSPVWVVQEVVQADEIFVRMISSFKSLF